MATHDYVIDNSTGANVRADINNVLQAILTNNSSSSSPSTTAAYMFWADTTSGTLKIRNSSNNAWVELLQLDGTLTLEDGSAASPALAFRDDLDTGIFSGGANQFQITTAGAQRLKLDSAETVFNDNGVDTDFRIESDTLTHAFFLQGSNSRIGSGTSSPSNSLHIVRSAENHGIKLERTTSNTGSVTINCSSNGVLALTADNNIQYQSGGSQQHIFFKGSDEIARFDTSRRVLIGHTSSQFSMKLSVAGTDGGGSSCSLSRFSNNSSPSTLLLSKSRGTSVGSYTVVQDDDQVGSIDFRGADGTDNNSKVAEIIACIDGTPGSNDMPGRLQFNTTSDGASSTTERMRIDSEGKVGIGTTPDAGTKLHLHQTDASAGNNLKIENNYSSGGNTNLLIASRQGDAVMATLAYLDSSTAIRFGTATAHPLLIMSNGSERARVTSGGVITVGGTDNSPAAAAVKGIALDGPNGYLAVHRTNTESFGFGRGGTGLLGRFFTDGTAVGQISVGSSSTTYSTTSSDRALKKNFEVWDEDVLSIFKNLNPQKFNFTKEDDSVQKTKGYIAQDLVEHFPEAYPKDETTDKYWFNPSGMVVYLMKAIQELEAKVASLETA